MESDNGTITVESIKVIKQQEFEWSWKIDNFEMNPKQRYVRRFSFLGGKLIM